MAYNGQGRERKEKRDSSPIMCFMQTFIAFEAASKIFS